MSDKIQVLVKDIMTEQVVTTRENEPIKNVVHLMLRDRISGMPVLNEESKVCGVVTTTDLFKILGELIIDRSFGSYDHMFSDRQITVEQVMTKNAVTVAPTNAVEEVIKLSVYKGIHTFPVVENDVLVGILGKRDILNAGFSFVE